MPEAIEVEKIQRLRVEPGETLVVTLPKHTTREQVDEITKVLRERIVDDIPILVVAGDVELSVIAR